MISVTILTKNSSKYIREVLSALTLFPEVLIYDSGSTDNTLEIVKEYPNVSIHQGIFEGFGVTHNRASGLAKYDWILSIDSDEILSPELSKEIRTTILDENSVYSILRNNFYNGKWIKGCGWYPDRQLKIYHRKKTRFTDDKVHEKIISDDLKIVKLKQPMKHYSYNSTADFLSKMQAYSELFASQNQGKKKSSLSKAVLHGTFAFLKSYILRKGFMDGHEGFVISIYNANTAFYKYLKLHEANEKIYGKSLNN